MTNVFQISLAAARVNKGLTQREVASALGVALTTVNNWENNKSIPSWAHVKAMCDLYEIPMDNLRLPTESN